MQYQTYPDYIRTSNRFCDSIPEGWELRKMKFMAAIQNGRDHKEVESDEGFNVLGSGGIFAKATEYLYDGESVLFGRKGTIDAPLYVNEKFWTVDTMYYTIVHSNTVPRFLYYLAKAIPFQYLATQTALPSMTQFDLGNFFLCFPKIEEQQKIVIFLDYKTQQIDQLIEKKKFLIEKLEEKRIAVITQVVTKGLDKNVKLIPSGVDWLGDVPEHWGIRRLKFMASIENGRDYKEVEVEEGGHPVYGSGGEFRRASEFLYEGESVLFGRKGTIDKPLYVNGRFWTVDTMFYSEIYSDTNPMFLYYSALTFQYQKLATQTALPSITQSDLGNYLLCYPNLLEQKNIASFLDAQCKKIDQMLEVNNRAMEALEEYRAAIITSAVTGKIDVREVLISKEAA